MRLWVGTSAIGFAALVALATPTPATAEQARAVLSVTAIVLPSCQIARRADDAPEVACSPGTRFSTMTSPRHFDRPLERASDILGTPIRGNGGVVFTSYHQPATERADPVRRGTQYLTISY